MGSAGVPACGLRRRVLNAVTSSRTCAKTPRYRVFRASGILHRPTRPHQGADFLSGVVPSSSSRPRPSSDMTSGNPNAIHLASQGMDGRGGQLDHCWLRTARRSGGRGECGAGRGMRRHGLMARRFFCPTRRSTLTPLSRRHRHFVRDSSRTRARTGPRTSARTAACRTRGGGRYRARPQW